VSAKEITDEERQLWKEYFQRMHPIAERFNAKYWPVLIISKSQMELERADYIGTFCFVFSALQARHQTKEATCANS
jgi:hypothetical protein